MAIQAHDVATVKRLLAEGAHAGGSLGQWASARRLVFTSLEPLPDSPSVEVLRLMLQANPQPLAVGTAKEKTHRLVDAQFAGNCSNRPCRDVSAIELVVRSWNPQAVRAMLDAGLTVTSQGTTDALVYAVADGNDEAARLLVEAGANPNASSTQGSGPMGGASAVEAARQKGNAPMSAYLESKAGR